MRASSREGRHELALHDLTQNRNVFTTYRLLHHRSKKFGKIQSLEMPNGIKTEIKFLTEKGLQSIRTSKIPVYETGTIDLGELSYKEECYSTYVWWIFRNHEVIESLNIVLADLDTLGKTPHLLDGPIDSRLHLIVRTFFNEFYRSKDSFYRFWKRLEKSKFVSRETVRVARAGFYKIHGDAIKFRNHLVHNFPAWRGKDEADLVLLSAAIKRGMALGSLETGTPIDIDAFLKGLIEKYSSDLLSQGVILRNHLQWLINELAKILTECDEF